MCGCVRLRIGACYGLEHHHEHQLNTRRPRTEPHINTITTETQEVGRYPLLHPPHRAAPGIGGTGEDAVLGWEGVCACYVRVLVRGVGEVQVHVHVQVQVRAVSTFTDEVALAVHRPIVLAWTPVRCRLKTNAVVSSRGRGSWVMLTRKAGSEWHPLAC